ncbi:MAG: rod shape-determining protein [Christensenellaceae bacterium]|nr:rod shape-determining protein [Christensenellaceae bacterium]
MKKEKPTMKNVFSRGLGIDLGTANTLVYERGEGIVLNEPSVVAMRPGSRQVVAVGSEARDMLGRTPGQIMAIRPLREGVIANFEVTQLMLRHFMSKVLRRKFGLRNPKVVLCVPCGITDVEKRAVEEAARAAGAGETYLIDEPLAAALGSGMDITCPRGRMVLDIGGGTSEVAVISLGGIVERRSLRVGGNYMDEAIAEYVRAKYSVSIGLSTAERIKISLGSLVEEEEESGIEVKGRSLITGLPVSVHLSGKEVRCALSDCADKIVAAVRQTLAVTPPELAADIYEDGIIMSGGSCLLKGLAERIYAETGIRAKLARRPLTAVAEGAGAAVEALESKEKFAYAARAQT